MTRASPFVSAILLAAGLVMTADAICMTSCRFSFCPSVYNNAFNIDQPDKAFTTAICDPSGKIVVGHVDSTGEAYVHSGYDFVRISQYRPNGLQQPYSSSFFKSYGIKDYGKDISGIGHETPQLNQVQFLNNLCVVVPLTAYQVLDKPYGTVIENRHPSTPFVDCVGFTTYVPSESGNYSPSHSNSNPVEYLKSANSDSYEDRSAPSSSNGDIASDEPSTPSSEASFEASPSSESGSLSPEESSDSSPEASADESPEASADASPEASSEPQEPSATAAPVSVRFALRR